MIIVSRHKGPRLRVKPEQWLVSNLGASAKADNRVNKKRVERSADGLLACQSDADLEHTLNLFDLPAATPKLVVHISATVN